MRLALCCGRRRSAMSAERLCIRSKKRSTCSAPTVRIVHGLCYLCNDVCKSCSISGNSRLLDVKSMVRRRFRRKRSHQTPTEENQQESEEVKEPVSPIEGTVGGSTIVDPALTEYIPRDRASMKSHHEDDTEQPPSRGSSRPTSEGTDVSRHSSLQPAPPAGREVGDDESDDDTDEDMDEHAFDHPSTYKPAPWIWVPKDTLGLSDVILRELHEVGLDASDLGASMNEKALVRVTSVPLVFCIFFPSRRNELLTVLRLTDAILQCVEASYTYSWQS